MTKKFAIVVLSLYFARLLEKMLSDTSPVNSVNSNVKSPFNNCLSSAAQHLSKLQKYNSASALRIPCYVNKTLVLHKISHCRNLIKVKIFTGHVRPALGSVGCLFFCLVVTRLLRRLPWV